MTFPSNYVFQCQEICLFGISYHQHCCPETGSAQRDREIHITT